MTALDWDRFRDLPGDPRTNFELLWRGAIKINYARFGTFRAQAQQPGVEFHLNLEQECPLGKPGQWFGWQTKWWDIGPGKQIGKTRKDDVEDSLETTKKHLPGLTDWVLCTRRPLTPTDQTWYDGLTPGFKLDNAVSDDLANLLLGDAALLRETYFGDLVLEPHRLANLQESAVAEVSERWFPEVHHSTGAEEALRRMLAEPDAWTHLAAVGSEIETFSGAIDREVAALPLPAPLQAELDELSSTAATVKGLLTEAYAHLRSDGERSWLEIDEVEVPTAPPKIPPVLRKLRALNHPASLACTNMVAHVRRAATLAKQVFDELQVRLAVVSGDAGYGKTQLAAKLTTATPSRPPGVLLHGRRLGARDELEKLATQVSCVGQPVQSFEALLAAVDAAAARARCRLPIVIDGLNEAESPSAWQPLLRKLHTMLRKYPSVLVVCTIRGAFVQRSIPTTVTDFVELDGFDEDLTEVAQKYFNFFKIDATGAKLPRELLRHPLALRIFCWVANPTRENWVALTDRPRSLNEMFEEYLDIIARRVEQLNDHLSADDVLRALQRLGVEMWKTSARDVDEERARELFGDTDRRWDDSILTALELEGVLIRQTPLDDAARTDTAPSDPSSAGLRVAVVYDLLAGHITASAMVDSERQTFVASLRSPQVTAQLAGRVDERHPLAIDIFEALTFILPNAGRGHLWQAVDPSLAGRALLRTTTLSAANVDAATAEAFMASFESLARRREFWPLLRSVRAAVSHPLNAVFFDSLLRPMNVAARDLAWSEWLRANWSSALADVRGLANAWKSDSRRTEADALRARWLMWVLTSTVRDLRDAATAALYWYGRHDPARLFTLAIDALEVNDPYVGERVVASAYGVAAAHQQRDKAFGEQLAVYLAGLARIVTSSNSTAPTYHRLVRYYITGTFEFARQHYPEAVPEAAIDGVAFTDGILPDPLADGDPRHGEVNRTIHMDFGNYTLGRLFEDRGNYDADHAGHAEATAQVLGVVYDLGWRNEPFSDIDSAIGSRNSDRGPGRIERYGKKYGWIGFYLVSGMLTARGERVPWLEVDIDPTFPQPSPQLPMEVPTWARQTPKDDRRWMLDGVVAVPDELLYCDVLDNAPGPWILVHAELTAKDSQTGRNTFGLFNTVAVEQPDLDKLMSWWSSVDHPGRDVIDLPGAYYLFAGEIPWHPRMVTSGDDLSGTGARADEGGPGSGSGTRVDPHEVEDPYMDELRIEAGIDDQGVDSAEGQCGDLEAGGETEEGFDLVAIMKSYGTEFADNNHKWSYETIRFESLAHTFAWEGHHSVENQEFAYVPNRRLSLQSQLRSLGASFNQVDDEGRPAAKSFAAPDGFEGHLLYLREDCVMAYTQDRALVQFGWGERQTHLTWPESVPPRLQAVYQSYGNIWRTHRVFSCAEAPGGAESPTGGETS